MIMWLPKPMAWWLRPVRMEAREGLHSAAVWKLLNLSPLRSAAH